MWLIGIDVGTWHMEWSIAESSDYFYSTLFFACFHNYSLIIVFVFKVVERRKIIELKQDVNGR